MASINAKYKNMLNKYIDRIILSGQDSAIDQITQEAASSLKNLTIQTLNAFYEHIELEFTKKQLQLSQESKAVDGIDLRRFEYSQNIIQKAIKIRKESHRKPNYPMSKNLLDHGVYWAGYKRKNKVNVDALTPEARKIHFNKDGIKALYYENDRGQLLSIFDTRVFLGLHKLWEKNGRQKEFSFSAYELLDILNLDKGGKNYSLLDDSLNTLYATSVVMQQFYIMGEKRTIETTKFRLVQGQTDQEILRADDKVRSKTHRIIFSDYLHDSLKEGFISFISLAMLEDLQNDTAQALYLMMNSMSLTKEEYYEYPVEIICKHIGIDEKQRPSLIKKTLLTACEQLKETEIIQGNPIFYTNENKKVFLRLIPSDWFRLLSTPLTLNVIENKLPI